MCVRLSAESRSCRQRRHGVGALCLARQQGLTLIELLMFVVVVGLALAAMLRLFTQTGQASADPQAQRQALAIAESMMEEVQLQPFTYCDPTDANVATASSAAGCATLPEAIGPEPGETRYTSPLFDNVNDYHGFSMNGVNDITNTPVAGLSGYRVSITVQNAALGSISAGSGDALLITVQVSGPHNTAVQLQGYRARFAPNAS